MIMFESDRFLSVFRLFVQYAIQNNRFCCHILVRFFHFLVVSWVFFDGFIDVLLACFHLCRFLTSVRIAASSLENTSAIYASSLMMMYYSCSHYCILVTRYKKFLNRKCNSGKCEADTYAAIVSFLFSFIQWHFPLVHVTDI